MSMKAFLCLALAVQVSADESSENVKALQEMTNAMMGGTQYAGVNSVEDFFAPKMECSFPAGPNPYYESDMSYDNCMVLSAGSSAVGTKYNMANYLPKKLACDGKTCFQLWTYDMCALDLAKADGSCLPETTVPGETVSIYTMDDKHIVTALNDWWKADEFSDVDKLAAKAKAKSAQLSATEPSKVDVFMPALILGFVMAAFAMGYVVGKKQGSEANRAEAYLKLSA